MGKQNYTEWKLAEAKRIRHKVQKDERDKRLAQSVADKEKSKDKKLNNQQNKKKQGFVQRNLNVP